MATPGHVVVIGGGIAGASAAYFIATSGEPERVTLVEAEPQLAQHTTGRSAALLTENYGAGAVRPLTDASLDFLHDPPGDLVDHPILSRRGIMTVANSPERFAELDRQLAAGGRASHPVVELSPAEATELAPHVALRAGARVMWEAHAHDIDVAALHQAYVRGFRAVGGTIETSQRVDAAEPAGRGWTVRATSKTFTADVLVDAAGAWGDVVASTAGVAPLGLQPLRRTAFMVPSPFADSADYPFVAGVDHDWYLRPDGRQFLCSPGDETPSEPCDARPEPIDIAVAIDRINANTHLGIRTVRSSWAGLRTFAPDRSMVIGPDPDRPTFVWCVGQGGTGIQTSPAAGRLTADLLLAGRPSSVFDDTGLDLAALLPDRLRRDQAGP